MTKVLLNRSGGGLDLKPEVYERLIEEHDWTTVEMPPEIGSDDSPDEEEWENAEIVDRKKELEGYLGEDEPNDKVEEYIRRNRYSLNDIERMEELRSHPDLIEVIEDFGTEDAVMDDHDEIQIVEIPDDVEWRISENDAGQEWVAEDHRTWP